MGEIGGLGFLGATALVTAYLWERVWSGRRRISCMTGMMLAMAVGMMAGLSGGVAAAGLMGTSLWPPTLAGMAIGVLAGALLGAPISLMALLDGGLSGLMGGMMGAMLGLMAQEALPSIAVMLLLTYLVVAVLLVQVLRQEVGDQVPFLRPMEAWILVLSVFVIAIARPLEAAGQAVARETAPPTEHSQAHSGMASGPQRSGLESEASSTTLEVTADDYSFDKQEVRIMRGQPIRLVLRNSGTAEHDLVIEGLAANVTSPGRHGTGLHVHALPGQIDTVEFIPLRSGTYQAVCTIPGHQEAGMEVAIDVID